VAKSKIGAVIFGCSGLELKPEEARFFAEQRPLGFILFRRNIDTPDQVANLVESLKAVASHDQVFILIDQEGGRVQRLKPPHWPLYPPAATFGEVTNSEFEQRELVRLSSRLMAHDLKALGINVDCVPVIDVPQPGAHDIIGDRAYGQSPETVATMGRAACEGLLAGGVLPVLKHIPGHGRALSDSHHDLPIVSALKKDLEETDFYPFRANADMPLAMTAHVVYEAIDKKNPATTSKKVIRLIRNELGFDGLLMSDDLSMKALSGDMATRTRLTFKAGCDVALHCNGDMTEMQSIAKHVPRLKGRPHERAMMAFKRILTEVEPLKVASARAHLEGALSRKSDSLKADLIDPTQSQANQSQANQK
jgi:beta-N-acetylhexosaminidase